MTKKLRVLIVEDSEDDALLIVNEIKEGGYAPKFERVETKEAFLSALEKGDWDIIISDYSLPKFSGLDAVKLLKESEIDLPFILVSGEIGEEIAVESLLAGAHDFIVKGKWGRLVPAIKRELKDAKVRQEQKLGEEKLKESEERYRSLTETATDAIISADCNGIIISWNKGAQTIFGYTTEEVMGKALTILMPEKYRSVHTKAIKQASETGILKTKGKLVELFGLKKDGCEFPIELSLGYWKKGEEIFYSCIIRDTTERKRLEEKEMQFGRILESSLNEIYIFDAETLRFIQVNTGARKNLGYSMEELKNLTPFDLKPEFTPEAFEKILQPLRNSEKEIIQFTTVHRRKDGSLYPVEVHIQLASFGSLSVFIVIILDITKREKAEEDLRNSEDQLRQAQKFEAIATLAGGIAHDFNNMLTSIIGYTEMTMGDFNEESNAYDNLKQVLNASYRAKDIVAQLMTYSRKSEENKMPLQIDKLVLETLKLLITSLPTSISIHKEIEEGVEVIMGNATQIQQVLFNLCINASHAMPEGGILKITLKNLYLDKFEVVQGSEISGAYIFMNVKDNGIGMDEVTKARIFDPFFTTKEVGKGTGLGLSTVFGIVKQHDGYITVDSEKGKGTSFNIYLPAMKKDAGTVGVKKPFTAEKKHAIFTEKETVLNNFVVKKLKKEIIVNIHGNVLIGKTEKDKLLELYVLSRSEKKKMIVNCSNEVQQSLKEDGFDKFLEIRVK